MNQLTHYDSIEALKAASRPIDTASAQTQHRHDQFEQFIAFLKRGPEQTAPSVTKEALPEISAPHD